MKASPRDPYFRHERWISVYGAYMAQQIHHHRVQTSNLPDETTLKAFIKEAETVADTIEIVANPIP